MVDEPDNFSIPYMLLADSAEAVGGKLYALGAGWDGLIIPNLPGPPVKPFALALGITVPYSHTNRKFTLTIEIVDADGNRIGDTAQVGLDSGRPPGMPAGTPQNMPMAFTMAPLFPGVGRYTVVARIDGEIKNHIDFAIHPMPQPFPTAMPPTA